MVRSIAWAVLLLPTLALAQPIPAAQDTLIVVTMRVPGPSDPPERFEIVEAGRRFGAPVRAVQPDPDAAALQPPGPVIRLTAGDGTTLLTQPFSWSRVITIPPAMPGSTPDGVPNEIPVERPEVTLRLPDVEGATRVEVVPAGSLTPVAGRTITAAVASPSRPMPDRGSAPPVQPGALHVLVLASGFSPDRIGLFPSIVQQVREQFLASEPFRSHAPRLALHMAQAQSDLACAPGCNGIDRLLCCHDASVINAAIASGLPFDEILVVHDTPIYAGLGNRDFGHYRTNSYTSYATAYNGALTAAMLLHEFGHSFGDLCDEYSYTTENIPYQSCANCRPTCVDLAPFGPTCLQGCSAAPAFFRPEPSIMSDLSIPTFNHASIHMKTPFDGLATRLRYFTGLDMLATPSPAVALQSAVSGNHVTLSWSPGSGGAPAASYTLQVGRAIGDSSVVNQSVGNLTSVSGLVWAGPYFWRVIAASGSASSAPSAEAQFAVGGVQGCSTPPDAPLQLTASVIGTQVTLRWSAVAGLVTTFVVEAGSAPGYADLYNAATGAADLTLQAEAPAGTYYVRIRARNGCGLGPPSPEQVVTVGG